MSPYQHGPPPAWAQSQNSQAPHWAHTHNNQQYNPYPHQPFIPPPPQPTQTAPPPQGQPMWYPQAPQQVPYPGWHDPYGQHQAPPQQEPSDDPTKARSKKWPKLSIILGADTTLARFKISPNKPSQELYPSTFYLYRYVPANATPTTYMRLFSKGFPWSIEISNRKDITCSDVWNAVWASLQEPLADSEWGILCSKGEVGQKHIEDILKAHRRRLDLNTMADKRILRCDYLGEYNWFMGLERDEEYQNARLLPGWDHAKKPVPEDTWLVKMGK